MGKKRNTTLEKVLPLGDEASKDKESEDAHWEGFSEDDKKLINLIAEIFVNSIMEKAYKNQQR
ncbi:MAG TPA: hypothetical protein VNY73_07030 [Bacteroidia bacterium]|jgi:hypothetical protein|nr:hypothetical protein [Bacteroidia bacterium]